MVDFDLKLEECKILIEGTYSNISLVIHDNVHKPFNAFIYSNFVCEGLGLVLGIYVLFKLFTKTYFAAAIAIVVLQILGSISSIIYAALLL